ncbi:MAG: transketolase [Anaerolineaceae bacterium]|nr:transketolase [Anaerolineaceae bacterium]
MNNEAVEKALNTIRFISADGVQAANSGHPGLPMGAAAIAYTLWTRHLKHNPLDPNWADRDRFVLSGGHGSMLLYTMLYLSGYPITKEDLGQFRQWGSITPGHPEWKLTPGVETTTGPLGQGFANGVGMALAEAHLAAEFNRDGQKIVDHYTFAIVTDGDLMEGISTEAASFAGHLKLGKLIYLYDDNEISIEGSTELAFTEDRAKKFEALGWHVQKVSDGNDVNAIDKAIQAAKKDPRPSLIMVRTIIGYGLPTKQGTAACHGNPPGWDELNQAKTNANWPIEPLFYAPEDVLASFRQAVQGGEKAQNVWVETLAGYAKTYPELAAEFQRRISQELPADWDKKLPTFPADEKGMATRVASHKSINALAKVLPELMGGSADLAPSNNTWMEGYPAFSAQEPTGRNIHFGVRELGMAAICNGMLVHGGIIPYCATFLVFSDYMRPVIRVAAISGMGTIFVTTHDSVAVGEDGPTHEPVEQLMSLRLIPHLKVFRPADANETMEAWKYAVSHRDGPTLLALTRQNLPTLDREKYGPASGTAKGAYVLYQTPDKKADLIIIATGSEVSLALKAAPSIEAEGIGLRVVSMPSWEVFAAQGKEYQNEVLPPAIQKRISLEAGTVNGWQKWVGCEGMSFGIDHFGASAPGNLLMEKFGFTTKTVLALAKKVMAKE